MRLALLLAVLTGSSVLAQQHGSHHQGQPGRNQPGSQQGDTATRLGLLAGQLGIAPVPGGGHTTGSQNPGAVHRDDSCWCQPINQVCTDLRPTNLDLVTRIINKPGSPGAPGSSTGRVPNCLSHQTLCCPRVIGVGNPDNPVIGVGNPGGPGNLPFQAAYGQCGLRHAYGVHSARSPTADFGEYPWMAVVLGPGQAYVAGGVLISDSWVLTAPHKLTQLQGLSVRLGDYDVSQPNELPQFPHYEVAVSKVVVHPKFDQKTLANDVALLKLAYPINLQQYGHVVPACVPGPQQLFDGQRCFVTGWGKDAFGPGNYQKLLQEVDVPVVESFRCQNLLRNSRLGSRFNLDMKSFICAGGEVNKDACQGDGGSPLVCGNGNQGWTVAGLVAWGVGCAQPNVPAAYVNVATYSNFIKRTINNG